MQVECERDEVSAAHTYSCPVTLMPLSPKAPYIRDLLPPLSLWLSLTHSLAHIILCSISRLTLVLAIEGSTIWLLHCQMAPDSTQ